MEMHKLDFHLLCCTLWNSTPTSSAQLPTAVSERSQLRWVDDTREISFLHSFFPLCVVRLSNIFNCMMNWKCGRNLTFIKFELFTVTLMVFLVDFLCHRRKSWPLNQTTGKRSCSYMASSASLLGFDWTLQLYLFKDKLKCRSHCGPWTS